MCLINTLSDKDKPVLFIDSTGESGNTFYIVGKIRQAYERLGRMDIVEEYVRRATVQSNQHFIGITRQYATLVKWHDSGQSVDIDTPHETTEDKIKLRILGFTTVQQFT